MTEERYVAIYLALEANFYIKNLPRNHPFAKIRYGKPTSSDLQQIASLLGVPRSEVHEFLDKFARKTIENMRAMRKHIQERMKKERGR